MLSIKLGGIKYHFFFFFFLVFDIWLNLGLNPGLLCHWWTLYPQDQYAPVIKKKKLIKFLFINYEDIQIIFLYMDHIHTEYVDFSSILFFFFFLLIILWCIIAAAFVYHTDSSDNIISRLQFFFIVKISLQKKNIKLFPNSKTDAYICDLV